MALDLDIPDTINYMRVEGEYIAKRLKLDVPPIQLPHCGRLSNDQHFLATSSDQSQYRLFLTQRDYIAFLLNHYFSEKNIEHDPYIRLHLQKYKGVEMERVRNFPWLAQISFPPDEIIHAINAKLPHLKTFKNESNVTFISRKEECKYTKIDRFSST
ncbi:unnamed protein product [Rodentolepis nana]|uniref:Uncharacterized protein n=1 Tax=Rodentolepis nana TaxID=102285 RepID=A0A0R3TFX7_RODNA|nr:unnamed protein product [Rodentolepis nana]